MGRRAVIVTWQDPPTRHGRVFRDEILAELRAHPGRWALIRTYPWEHSGSYPKHPADLELRFVYYTRRPGPARTELYARARRQP